MRACDNPFRSERVLAVRYRLEGATWDKLLARWAALQNRGAIVGPHGTGKTTLLEALEPQLQEQGFRTRMLRLSAESPELEPGVLEELGSGLTRRDVVLLDGAEQLSALAWRWFRWRTRRAGGLLITTHQAGRLPTLWECRTSAELLAQIAGELLGPDSHGVQPQAEILFCKHRGNLREALREWYDRVAS